MSTPTLQMTTQINDSFTYAVNDPLADPVNQQVNLANAFKMAYGSTASGANATVVVPTKFYLATRTITISSSTLDIDLTLLTDIFGNILNFSKIYRMVLHNNDATGGSGVLVGGAASNAWSAPFNGSTTAKFSLPAGGDLVFSSPYAGYNVTAGSKVLRLTNDAASPSGANSVTILIAGG